MNGLLLAPIAAAALLYAVAALTWVQRRNQARLVGDTAGAPTGARTDILYFTGENCTICHVAQRPALARLVAGGANVVIREVDITAEPDLARRYRVMTLPTTIVLDGRSRIAAINVGFATETLLREQLERARAGAAEVALA